MANETRLIDFCCFNLVPADLFNQNTFTTANVMQEFNSFVSREVLPNGLVDRIVMSHAYENDDSRIHGVFGEIDEEVKKLEYAYLIKLIILHSLSGGIEIDFRHLKGEPKKQMRKIFFHFKQQYKHIFDLLSIPIHSHQSYVVFGDEEREKRTVQSTSPHLEDLLLNVISLYDKSEFIRRMKLLEDRKYSIIKPEDIEEYERFQRSIPFYLFFQTNSDQVLDYTTPDFFLPVAKLFSKTVVYEVFVGYPQKFKEENIETLVEYAKKVIKAREEKIGFFNKDAKKGSFLRYLFNKVIEMRTKSGYSEERIELELKPHPETDLNLIYTAYQMPCNRVQVWTLDADVKEGIFYLNAFKKALQSGWVNAHIEEENAINLQKYFAIVEESVWFYDPRSKK